MRFILLALFLSFHLVCSACPFCDEQVIQRQLIHETEHSLLLYCLTPATQGNVLLIPKRHMVRFEELKEEEVLDLYRLIQKVQDVFQKHYCIKDYLLLQKNGVHAGQSVDHIHIHVIPCPPNLDLIRTFQYREKLTPEEMRRAVEEWKPYFCDE